MKRCDRPLISIHYGNRRKKKKLEEMSLLDDFLATSVTSHRVYGEKVSRFILTTILQREIGNLNIVV